MRVYAPPVSRESNGVPGGIGSISPTVTIAFPANARHRPGFGRAARDDAYTTRWARSRRTHDLPYGGVGTYPSVGTGETIDGGDMITNRGEDSGPLASAGTPVNVMTPYRQVNRPTLTGASRLFVSEEKYVVITALMIKG